MNSLVKSFCIPVSKAFLIVMWLSQQSFAGPDPIVNGGPNDYYDPLPRIQEVVHSVERLHLSRAEQFMKKGDFGYYTWEELDFTLRWFPTHPRGLMAMSNYYMQSPNGAPPGKTAEYYFTRAIDYRPRDFPTRVIYGIYLHKTKHYKEALTQYQLAEQIQPDSADLQYNMGLLYIDLKNYEDAKKHAKKAYDLGHPLPGLRNKLVKLGIWSK